MIRTYLAIASIIACMDLLNIIIVAMSCPTGLMDGVREVSIKNLISELKEVTAAWFELGAFLDIPESKLREIVQDFADIGAEQCMVEMIMTWRQMVIPTWNAIIGALTGIGMSSLAVKIANKYSKLIAVRSILYQL